MTMTIWILLQDSTLDKLVFFFFSNWQYECFMAYHFDKVFSGFPAQSIGAVEYTDYISAQG